MFASGQSRRFWLIQARSALPPIATEPRTSENRRQVPESGITQPPVGGLEERLRHRSATAAGQVVVERFFLCISDAGLRNLMRLLRAPCFITGGSHVLHSVHVCSCLVGLRSRRQVANGDRSTHKQVLNGNSGFNHSKSTRTHRSASAFRSNHAAITVTFLKHGSVSATMAGTGGNIWMAKPGK